MANAPPIPDVASSDRTAVAIAQAARRSFVALPTTYYSPTPSGAFTHLTTAIETTVTSTLVLGLTTAVTSGDLIIATSSLQDRVNLQGKLINRLVYILEANGMTT